LTIDAFFGFAQETVRNFNGKPFGYELYIAKNKSINKTIT